MTDKERRRRLAEWDRQQDEQYKAEADAAVAEAQQIQETLVRNPVARRIASPTSPENMPSGS